MIFLLVIITTLPVLYYFYSLYCAKVPILHVQSDSDLHKRSRKHLTFLDDVYYPPWWAQNSLVMTLLRTFQKEPDLPWEREIVTFPDGGIAALDWLRPKNEEEDAPLLILFPGIAGHTHGGPYLWNPAKEALDKGWRVLVLNRRGLDVPLKSPKIAGYENSEDVTFILEHFVAPKYPKSFKVGCGFSMGGMVLFNYLASRNKENAIIDIGLSVSSPFDLHATSRGVSGMFTKFFLSRPVTMGLIDFVKPHKEVLEEHVNWEMMCGSREVGGFEHYCQAHLNGYEDMNHYYYEASPYLKVHKMEVPFLVLTSEDDYFVPIEWMPLDRFLKNENIAYVVTAHGGHTAYMDKSDINASGFVEKVLFQWAEMHLKENEE